MADRHETYIYQVYFPTSMYQMYRRIGYEKVYSVCSFLMHTVRFALKYFIMKHLASIFQGHPSSLIL